MIPKTIKPIGWLFLLLISVIFTTGCSNNKFKVKGEIYGAEKQTIILEKSDFYGRWLPVDSTKINGNGGFSFAFPAPMSPEIYRLSLNNQFIYFPVDSVETITVNSSFDKFGTDFSLAGSPNAENLANFEKDLHARLISNPDSLDSFKRSVFSNYMKDNPGSVVNFYILTKTIDGKPVFDPNTPSDRKYFSAVATGYKTMRPDDPRTAILEQTALHGMKMKNAERGKYLELEAQELGLIDIDLQNEHSTNVKLSDIAGKGKPVVVIFSLLNSPESPELNIALANIYNRKGGSVEFYNVSLDEDQYTWRDAARNLPWITVYSPGQANSEDAAHYNVFQLPSFFLYDADGNLTKRIMTLDELNKSL